MLIIYLEKLEVFGKQHANSRRSLATWIAVVEKVEWKNRNDILKDFPKAKMIANSRARFEIAHNTYRLIAYVNYDHQIVQIRFIGTHTEYDRIDPAII